MSSEIPIETTYDEKRGCGWRKPRAKYLVGGYLCRPCGKLPIPLERCPVCQHGIKRSRGWTWIGALSLIGPGACDHEADCRGADCTLFDPPERAGLLWVGSQFYPTPESFIREADRIGICRRLAQIPKDFRVGETLVFLAHREVWFEMFAEPRPGIFAAFTPHAIEYVVGGDEAPEELERLVKQGCTLVKVVREGAGDARRASAHPEPGVPGPDDLRTPGQRPADGGTGGRGASDGPVQ
jgi:hypothetical protein